MAKNKTFINILAQSDVYEVREIIEESKAPKRLQQIREHYEYLNDRHKRRDNKRPLTVKTSVANPPLL